MKMSMKMLMVAAVLVLVVAGRASQGSSPRKEAGLRFTRAPLAPSESAPVSRPLSPLALLVLLAALPVEAAGVLTVEVAAMQSAVMPTTLAAALAAAAA